jgi:hypothetical protein
MSEALHQLQPEEAAVMALLQGRLQREKEENKDEKNGK